MLTLLNPAALLALAGLLVPVAIHLWNRRPGREVPVGSLRWLAAGANRRLRNLKPEQLWLLLLRAALLAVLAVAVAGPAWRRALPAGRGQVLLSPEVLGSPALAALRPGIDALRRRGYGLRWLAAGFPKMSGAAWRAAGVGPRDSARLLGAVAPAVAFSWARVQQAAEAFAGQPLYVVTPAALAGLQGPHPALRAGVSWQALPGAAPATWLQEADGRADSISLVIGKSTENQTTFSRKTVRQPLPGQLVRGAGIPAVRLQSDAGQQRLVATADSLARPEPPVLVAPPLTVAIYATPAYAPDARYLRAGIRAAAAGLAFAPTIQLTTSPPDTSAQWLFWLSAEPLPEPWRAAVRRGARVWQEPAGPGRADEARLVPVGASETPASIFRRGDAQVAAGAWPVWVDGRGRAVLSRHAAGAGAIYQLHTRLHPAWSNLGDNAALPARLLALLHPNPTAAPALITDNQTLSAHDQRAIDPAQLPAQQPGTATTSAAPMKAAPAASQVVDLRPWLVLVAGLLFALERLWASRRENRVLNYSL